MAHAHSRLVLSCRPCCGPCASDCCLRPGRQAGRRSQHRAPPAQLSTATNSNGVDCAPRRAAAAVPQHAPTPHHSLSHHTTHNAHKRARAHARAHAPTPPPSPPPHTHTRARAHAHAHTHTCALWRLRRTTCCQMLRSSSTRTGLMRKSHAPCVTPRMTVVCSPLADITVCCACGVVQGRGRGGGMSSLATTAGQHAQQTLRQHPPSTQKQLTDDRETQLQPNCLQELEAIHVWRWSMQHSRACSTPCVSMPANAHTCVTRRERCGDQARAVHVCVCTAAACSLCGRTQHCQAA
jgi:hypothetical protein